jgi:hypothetical protein
MNDERPRFMGVFAAPPQCLGQADYAAARGGTTMCHRYTGRGIWAVDAQGNLWQCMTDYGQNTPWNEPVWVRYRPRFVMDAEET